MNRTNSLQGSLDSYQDSKKNIKMVGSVDNVSVDGLDGISRSYQVLGSVKLSKRESGLKKNGIDLPQYEFDGLKVHMNGEDTNDGKEEDELEDEV